MISYTDGLEVYERKTHKKAQVSAERVFKSHNHQANRSGSDKVIIIIPNLLLGSRPVILQLR